MSLSTVKIARVTMQFEVFEEACSFWWFDFKFLSSFARLSKNTEYMITSRTYQTNIIPVSQLRVWRKCQMSCAVHRSGMFKYTGIYTQKSD